MQGQGVYQVMVRDKAILIFNTRPPFFASSAVCADSLNSCGHLFLPLCEACHRQCRSSVTCTYRLKRGPWLLKGPTGLRGIGFRSLSPACQRDDNCACAIPLPMLESADEPPSRPFSALPPCSPRQQHWTEIASILDDLSIFTDNVGWTLRQRPLPGPNRPGQRMRCCHSTLHPPRGMNMQHSVHAPAGPWGKKPARKCR